MSVRLGWLILILTALFFLLPVSSSLHGNSDDAGDRFAIAVELFILFCLIVMPFWVIVRGINRLHEKDRMLRLYLVGHCNSCGYDLRGNESGICPECGTPIPASSRNLPSRREPPADFVGK